MDTFKARERPVDKMDTFLMVKPETKTHNDPKSKLRKLFAECRTDLLGHAESESSTVAPTSPVKPERPRGSKVPALKTSSGRVTKSAMKSKAPMKSTTAKSVAGTQKWGKSWKCAKSKRPGNLRKSTNRVPMRKRSHVEPESSRNAAKKSDLKDNASNAPALVPPSWHDEARGCPPGKQNCPHPHHTTSPNNDRGYLPVRGGQNAVRPVEDISQTTLLLVLVLLAGVDHLCVKRPVP